MREVNIGDYWGFGYNYRLLRFNSEGRAFRKGKHTLTVLVDGFFHMLEHLNLQVTQAAAGDLTAIRERVKAGADDAVVDAALAKEIEAACTKLDETLTSEIGLRTAFMVTPKRLPLDTLLATPGKAFALGVYSDLPTIAQFDFAQACRCIAFGLPTAAAFHAMRGVEGVLRHYYCTVVKRGRLKEKEQMWGAMVTRLRRRRDAPPEPLLDNLDSIRRNFRNPTQHPDARYDTDGAEDLLGLSVEATNRMVKDIAARNKVKNATK